jgi:hypothetical protein
LLDESSLLRDIAQKLVQVSQGMDMKCRIARSRHVGPKRLNRLYAEPISDLDFRISVVADDEDFRWS